MHRKKFKPGRLIRTLGRLCAMLEAGAWIYWRHKPQHPGWIEGIPIRALRNAMKNQWLREAVRANPTATEVTGR